MKINLPIVSQALATLSTLAVAATPSSGRTMAGHGMADLDHLPTGAAPVKVDSFPPRGKPLASGHRAATAAARCVPVVRTLPLSDGLPEVSANLVDSLKFGYTRADPLDINREIFVLKTLIPENLEAAIGEYHKDDVLSALYIKGANVTAPANASLADAAIASGRCEPLCRNLIGNMSDSAKEGVLAGTLLAARGFFGIANLKNGSMPSAFQVDFPDHVVEGKALASNAFAIGDLRGDIASRRIIAQTHEQLFAARIFPNELKLNSQILDRFGKAIPDLLFADTFLDSAEPEVKLLLAATIQGLTTPVANETRSATPMDDESYRLGIKEVINALVFGERDPGPVGRSIARLLGGLSLNSTAAEVGKAMDALNGVPFVDRVGNPLIFDPRGDAGSSAPPVHGGPRAAEIVLGVLLAMSASGNVFQAVLAKLKERRAAAPSAIEPARADDDASDADHLRLGENAASMALGAITARSSLTLPASVG